MKIPTIGKAREADAYTIENEPITSVDLMERAATTAFNWIDSKLKSGRKPDIKVFCGMGNNGGDGLVLGRLFRQSRYNVDVYLVRHAENLSHDAQVNYDRLSQLAPALIHDVFSKDDFPLVSNDDIVIDALFGSGLTRPLSGLTAELIEYLNDNQAVKIAIDIASGLNGDGFATSKFTFKPDYTLSFQFPKLALLLPENEQYVGEWTVLDIKIHPYYVENVDSTNFFTTEDVVTPLLRRRARHSHKGTYGHALLVAGSAGKTGAALLAAESCLRSGVGLLTAHLPQSAMLPLQIYLPEAMCNADKSTTCFSEVPDLLDFTAVGVGPGLGKSQETATALKHLIQNVKVPLILDADALNIVAENKTWLAFLPPLTILTPHPKEFERLFGKTENSLQRLELQREMSRKFNLIIVLKGAYTAVSFPTGACFFNSTGNPGMATAGSGDVLTGIVLSLLAQRYSPEEAAVLGVYLHGSAGNIAASEIGMESLLASDISKNIGNAFAKLRKH